MIKCKYYEVLVGDLFSLNCPYVRTATPLGEIHKIKGDKRVYRREKDGAIQVRDVYGDSCEARGYKVYPYYDEPVWKIEEINL